MSARRVSVHAPPGAHYLLVHNASVFYPGLVLAAGRPEREIDNATRERTGERAAGSPEHHAAQDAASDPRIETDTEEDAETGKGAGKDAAGGVVPLGKPGSVLYR